MIELDRNELIYKIKTSNPNLTWREIVDLLAREYGVITTIEGVRKGFYRQEKKYSKLNKQEVKPIEKVSVERKQDGTMISERKILMSETDMKDDAFVLKAHGFDPDKYDIVNIVNNLWTSQSAENGELMNYQSKITVKPKKDNGLSKQDVAEIVAEIKPLNIKFELIKQPNEELALEVDFSDIHIGSLSWHEEVGEDFDSKIAFEIIKRQVSQAREIIEQYKVGKVYLCFLGDFLQADTTDGKTNGGTLVDTDSRSKKMVQKGLETAMYIVESLSITPTEVIWVEGNHSRLVEFSVFWSLQFIYEKAKHIKFDVSPKVRKAFVYGDNLVGLHHGEMSKDESHSWLQMEFREEWGKSKYAETHSGHIHQEKVIERHGIINRTNPTSKIQDSYEYINGWKSNKASVAYLWTKTRQLKGQFWLR